jgi:hypothetical protein
MFKSDYTVMRKIEISKALYIIIMAAAYVAAI